MADRIQKLEQLMEDLRRSSQQDCDKLRDSLDKEVHELRRKIEDVMKEASK